MNPKIISSLILIIILVFLYACNFSPDKASVPYPEPSTTSDQSYPSPFPSIEPSIDPAAIRFQLLKPLLSGMTEVSGTGLPGVPIGIYDVTYMGTLLGESVIKKDGTFKVRVDVLEERHRIGIGLGDISGTKWKPEDFQNPGYNGDEAMLVPMVGFFFDTAMVQPKQ